MQANTRFGGRARFALLALVPAVLVAGTFLAAPVGVLGSQEVATQVDHVQVRQYHGDRYIEVRVPSEGDIPQVRWEIIQPAGDLLHFARYGDYVVSVEWSPSADKPDVFITYDPQCEQEAHETK